MGPADQAGEGRCPDLFGADGMRVVPQRTSNAYHFSDPGGAGVAATLNKKSGSAPKSEKPTGTPNQGFFSSFIAAFGGERTARFGREVALREDGSWDRRQTVS